jgi:hypothetical protein
MGAAVKVSNCCSVSKGLFLEAGHQNMLAMGELSGGFTEAKERSFMN